MRYERSLRVEVARVRDEREETRARVGRQRELKDGPDGHPQKTAKTVSLSTTQTTYQTSRDS